jgi:hypothetical protein
MRAFAVAIAAIIPALIAVATLMYPVGATNDQNEVVPIAVERAPTTLLNYVPPPHVRVIPIYGAMQDR